jgi:hypothetical protein
MLSGRTLVAACVSCLAGATLAAQPSPEKTSSTGADRSDVQAIIAMARMSNAVPPEFGADAILTLVESGLIPEHRLQHDLLEEAFVLAGRAQEKIALKRGAGDSAVTGALHGAFGHRIDQASLRARAIDAMLRLDNHAARELFERIELPIPSSIGCDQQTVPDFTAYYLTMLEVARITPGREQLEAFFAAHMPRFRSAAQITPFARVLMQIRGIENMPVVIDAFAARLPDLMQDSRVFSTYFEESIEAVGQLITSSPMSSRERLIQQSRAWVLRSIGNGVCAEPVKYTVGFDGSHRLAPVTDPVTQFNREVAWHSRNARIDTSVATQAAASSVPNSSEYFDFFRTHLMLARDDEGALDLTRWRSETAAYIARLNAWSWPSSQIVSNIVSFRDLENDTAVSEARQEGGLKEPRPEGAVDPSSNATNFYLEKSGLSSKDSNNGEAVSEARQHGALKEPRPEGAVDPSSNATNFYLEKSGLSSKDSNNGETVSEARQHGALKEPRPEGAVDPSSNATNFYLEKSDLLTHVLFLERHAAASSTSGPVKITWSGARKPEGPRVDIPSRDRVLTGLVSLFDSEAAHRAFNDRHAVWFSPMRDLLSIPGMPDLYAASNHPVLSLYGHLAKLVAVR